MSKIQLLSEDQASGKTAELYQAIKTQMGKVPNVYQIYGHSATALSANLQLSQTLSEGNLSKKEIEIVSLVISQINGCHYCIAAHSLLGGMNGISDENLLKIRRGKSENNREKALINFTTKVYNNKGRISEEELNDFLNAGYTTGNVVEVIGLIALNTFNNFTNNLAETPVDFPIPANLEQIS